MLIHMYNVFTVQQNNSHQNPVKPPSLTEERKTLLAAAVPVQKVASSSSVRLAVTEADPLGALDTPQPCAASTGMTKSATCPMEMDESRTPTPSSRKVDDNVLGEHSCFCLRRS